LAVAGFFRSAIRVALTAADAILAVQAVAPGAAVAAIVTKCAKDRFGAAHAKRPRTAAGAGLAFAAIAAIPAGSAATMKYRSADLTVAAVVDAQSFDAPLARKARGIAGASPSAGTLVANLS
jgi:hypothetical protein